MEDWPTGNLAGNLTSRARTLLEGVEREEEWLAGMLHLTANEPLMSDTARRAAGTRMSDRYYMGGGDDAGIVDFAPFTFLGWPATQELVTAAEQAACRMLNACAVTLAPLSGLHAMTCALLAMTDPGDTVMSLDLDHGGHFATQRIIERIGRRHVPTIGYDVEGLSFDLEALATRFAESGASTLYLDTSFALGPHDVRGLREALGPRATIIYDASHALGLIMGGQFQAPLLEGADVICGNTHKTLPGPQKGLIAFRDAERARRGLEAVQGGLISSPHGTSVIALAVTILEMDAFGSTYARGVIENAEHLGVALRTRGMDVRHLRPGRVTANHQVHLFTDQIGPYRELYAALIANGIVVNFDKALGERTFIRLGTQEITRRGMSEREMDHIAWLLIAALAGNDVCAEVADLVGGYRHVFHSFDPVPRASVRPDAPVIPVQA